MEQVTKTERERMFGRRKGRPLHKHKAELVETLLPKISINLEEGKTLDLAALFGPSITGVQMEVGFGGGEHLAAQALAHPDVGFIGCEPFLNGIANLLVLIEAQGIKNIRIFPDDARRVLDALPDACLTRAFVLFADPWPKARHAERRFISEKTMPRLARTMAVGAELRLATDVLPLAAWMEEKASANPDFTLLSKGEVPPEGWVRTRYEQKGLNAGRQPVYLIYRR